MRSIGYSWGKRDRKRNRKRIEKGREEGIEKGREEGIEKGREEGADIISRLNTILAKEGDLDKIIKANTDKKYRNELLKKYNLLRDYEK